jgi:hypothetical protein
MILSLKIGVVENARPLEVGLLIGDELFDGVSDLMEVVGVDDCLWPKEESADVVNGLNVIDEFSPNGKNESSSALETVNGQPLSSNDLNLPFVDEECVSVVTHK